MKKMLSVLLAIMMIATLALTGCGQNNDPTPTPDPAPATRTFTDSLGREVILPANLSRSPFPALWPRSWYSPSLPI